MKIHKAYKIRLYPDVKQQEILNKTFRCCRFLWNKMLDERIQVYRELQQDRKLLNSHKYMFEKDYKIEFEFLKEVDSKALQSSTRNLLFAFKNFFNNLKQNRKIGFPNYKSLKHKQSYTTYNISNNIKIKFSEKRIKLPKIKKCIKFRDDRIFDEPIKHITVSKTKTSKYFASIITECKLDVIPKQEIHIQKIVAFDMSSSKFLVCPQMQMKNPHFYRNEEKNLKKLHRQLSRKKLGSKNRKKAKIKLSRKYEKIYNRKSDWIHKITTQLSNENEAIILEDLNIRGIQQFNSGISKSITLDFSWNQFLSILSYKMHANGNHVIIVSRWFPSSKICSTCGTKLEKLDISTREWKCKGCGSFHDRDINAAMNLYTEGLKQLNVRSITLISTVGTTESYACEDDRRLPQRSIHR